MSMAQISALVCGVGGFGALVAATTSNEWKVTTRASSVITATWVYQGLWMNCAGNALGSFHCRPHFTIFKVEGSYLTMPQNEPGSPFHCPGRSSESQAQDFRVARSRGRFYEGSSFRKLRAAAKCKERENGPTRLWINNKEGKENWISELSKSLCHTLSDSKRCVEGLYGCVQLYEPAYTPYTSTDMDSQTDVQADTTRHMHREYGNRPGDNTDNLFSLRKSPPDYQFHAIVVSCPLGVQLSSECLQRKPQGKGGSLKHSDKWVHPQEVHGTP
ncbi:hypothetical protein ACRRTK_019268 [Alexandromys fortis]